MKIWILVGVISVLFFTNCQSQIQSEIEKSDSSDTSFLKNLDEENLIQNESNNESNNESLELKIDEEVELRARNERNSKEKNNSKPSQTKENSTNTAVNTSNDNQNTPNKRSFKSSLITGFLLIFISEIGDNTFIIALIFSLKFGMFKALIISSITLILLNAFWLFVGASLNLIMYDYLIKWGATCLFFVFATIMLLDGLKMDNKLIIDEVLEKEEEIENKMVEPAKDDKEENKESKEQLLPKEEGKNVITNTQESNAIHVKKGTLTWSIIWSYSMSLIVAECGDKSQITAITISAAYDFKGVLIGSSLAFFFAILIAVSIGQFFSKHVSEKMVVLIGAALFYLYAIDLLIENLYAVGAI